MELTAFYWRISNRFARKLFESLRSHDAAAGRSGLIERCAPHSQGTSGISGEIRMRSPPALMLPWSNGLVEGQIYRLKMIKRQTYGRASSICSGSASSKRV